MILLLRLLFSFSFDWEDISNTRDTVSSAIQTPRISPKTLRCASFFQLSSQWLDFPMKHFLSCLIYFFKHPEESWKYNAQYSLSFDKLSVVSAW